MTLLKTLAAVLAFAVLAPAGAPARADDAVLLTVTGLESPVTFTRAELEALGPVTFETSTIWTEGVQSFTGVPLDALLDHLGVEGGVLRASAINDYTIEIPVDDAVPDGPILAYLRGGEPMSVRDKGPLWIVYPYDANPAYQSEVIYSRSIWQLDRIELAD